MRLEKSFRPRFVGQFEAFGDLAGIAQRSAEGLDVGRRRLLRRYRPATYAKSLVGGEMIVLAFANGDRRALKDLLSSEVYESFEAVIKDREKHEQKTETRFVSIDKAELVSAEARDRAAQLTVRFVSQMISVTRDKAGTIVDGNPDKVADITDVWTFARDTSSRDPNWKLVGTGSAA
jgi:predicted lipid-binding transport protein (Tim44 family)